MGTRLTRPADPNNDIFSFASPLGGNSGATVTTEVGTSTSQQPSEDSDSAFVNADLEPVMNNRPPSPASPSGGSNGGSRSNKGKGKARKRRVSGGPKNRPRFIDSLMHQDDVDENLAVAVAQEGDSESDAGVEDAISGEWHHRNGRTTRVLLCGDCVFSAGQDGFIIAWDRETGRCLRVFKGHSGTIACIRQLDGLLYSGSFDRTVRSWDINTGRCKKVFSENSNWVLDLCVHDGSLYCAGYECMVTAFDLTTGKKKPRVFNLGDRNPSGHNRRIESIVMDSNQRILYTAGADCTVCGWSLETHDCIKVLRHREPVLHIEISESRQLLFASQSTEISVWDLKTNENLTPFIGVSSFDVVGDILVAWNRSSTSFEFWHFPTYTLLHREKVAPCEGSIHVPSLKYDYGRHDLFFCLGNAIEKRTVKLPSIEKLRNRIQPAYIRFPELFNYAIAVLLFPPTRVAKAIDLLSRSGPSSKEQEPENGDSLTTEERPSLPGNKPMLAPNQSLDQQISILIDYLSSSEHAPRVQREPSKSQPHPPSGEPSAIPSEPSNLQSFDENADAILSFQITVDPPPQVSQEVSGPVYTPEEMALDFKSRTELFYRRIRGIDLLPNSQTTSDGASSSSTSSPIPGVPASMMVNIPLSITVRRQTMVQDALKWFSVFQLMDFKRPMIVFIPEEPGLDMGGITREFYSIMSKEILDPNNALFVRCGVNHTAHPNPSSSINEEHLTYFRFVGCLIGKALRDFVLMSTHFTHALFKLMVSQPVTYQDLENVDPQMYRSMDLILRSNDIAAALDMCFVAEVNDFGTNNTYELQSNGHNILVNEENKSQFVAQFAKWRLVESVRPQIEQLLSGLFTVIPRPYLQIFSPEELELLLCGSSDLDVEDWQQHTEYKGGFTAESPCIQWFWKMVEEMNQVQRAKLLQFASGTSCLPAEGFQQLEPRFSIVRLLHAPTSRLPLARTCFNRLDIPEYESPQILRARFSAALELGLYGFDLT